MSEVQDRRFVILSLDGGGVRGLLTAHILKNIEQLLDRHFQNQVPLGRRVDLIAGTSTGGILALGLGAGRTAAELVEWYEAHIPRIFAASRARKLLRFLLMPRHPSAELRTSLTAFFGDRTLAAATSDLCIVSVALRNAIPRLYKTGYLSRNLSRESERMVDVAMATSAAPTYFEASSPPVGGGPLIDGGLCANNPSIVALTDALQYERPASMRGRPKPRLHGLRDEIVMISVGTGRRGAMPYNPERLIRGGVLCWARSAIEVFTEAQGALAERQAAFLVGPNYLRINPAIGAEVKLDDPRGVANLKVLADLDKQAADFIEQRYAAFGD